MAGLRAVATDPEPGAVGLTRTMLTEHIEHLEGQIEFRETKREALTIELRETEARIEAIEAEIASHREALRLLALAAKGRS